ncbi:hypothetical protein J3L14_17805 [Burkholderia pseudomallei]|uniref:hypothetical protein n=1 Tax=Burkholderia pseudomallei TaxID=28450 RepID=UPI001A9F3715|nr:hypothetical protein [Burkholderia pseudomallei]QTB79298.1 hypothetical protein J3L14_17805 [Burkholderia pseudomallei]
MIAAVEELDFESVGGALADSFSESISGKSPYNGTLPFGLEFRVGNYVIDDVFVVTVTDEKGTVIRRESPGRFERDAALCEAISGAIESEHYAELSDSTASLAARGYRFISTETGLARGHVETVTLIADPISELDAALQLNSEPEYIYDLLDSGADAMRHHIAFGRPYDVAIKLAKSRADYEEVTAYMRGYGCH